MEHHLRRVIVEDPFNLNRFIDAQDRGGAHESALAELRAGRKRGHWIWFVFPQIAGLGTSSMSRLYAIGSLDEAAAYLAHPVLGARLREAARAVLAHPGTDAAELLGEIDAIKLRSSMTLFAEVPGADPSFARVLTSHFGGNRDEATIRLLYGWRP